MNYTDIDARLQGRNRDMRKFGNNTYLVRQADHLAMRYHNTEVAQYWPDGTIRLDSGGWRTSTTKERINWGLPSGYRLTQDRGVWYLNEEVFQDGITIRSGEITNAGVSNPKADRKLKTAVRQYAKLCAEAIPLDQPDGGDCWYCSLVTEEGETLGDAIKDTDHIDHHIRDGYVVPSLVAQALKQHHNAPMAFWQTFKDTGWDGDRDFGRQATQRAVYRYILRRKGYSI